MNPKYETFSVFTKRFLAIGIVMTTLVIPVLMSEAFDTNYDLKLNGSVPITVKHGQTVERKISGISNPGAGRFLVKIKWYTVGIRPNKLTIKLKHGNTTLKTERCYSYYAPRARPDCNFSLDITKSEAKKAGDWKLTFSNTSGFDVKGLDIRKGGDPNPLAYYFRSTFVRTTKCNTSGDLRLTYAPFTIRPGKSRTQSISLIFGTIYGNSGGIEKGKLTLIAKWHVDRVIPTFTKLKIELLKPNGQVAKTGNYYSYHAPGKSPKYNITYYVSQSDANLSGLWKLRITNYGPWKILRFNIRRESGDLSPLVPSFKSRFKSDCLG